MGEHLVTVTVSNTGGSVSTELTIVVAEVPPRRNIGTGSLDWCWWHRLAGGLVARSHGPVMCAPVLPRLVSHLSALDICALRRRLRGWHGLVSSTTTEVGGS